MRRTRRLTLSTVAAAVLGLLAATAPSGAAAADNPYSAEQICGAGYRVIGGHQVWSADGTTLGIARLLYSPATGKNCAVLLKSRQLGTPTYTAVSLKKQGAKAPWVVDFGDYRYYAGPVYVTAAGTCVRFGASMSFPNGRKANYISPFQHCS